MAVEASVLGDGVLEFQLESEVVIRHMSRLYKDASSVVRELLANEEAACISVAEFEPGFDYARDCGIEVAYYTHERRLVIRGVNSLGIDTDTLKNVLRYYGRSLNAEVANASGQFGLGFKGFLQLVVDEKSGEQGSMIMRTHARKTGEKYAVRCTARGFQPIEDSRAEEMMCYGTELEIVHKPSLEPGEIIDTIRENSFLSPVQIYLTVVDERPNKLSKKEYDKLDYWKQKEEHAEDLTQEREKISQHSLTERLARRLRNESYNSQKLSELPRVRMETKDYEAIGVFAPQKPRPRGRYYGRSDRQMCFYLVGRAIEYAKSDVGGDDEDVGDAEKRGVAPHEHFDYLHVNFKNEDVVEPTPSRDALDGDQLRAVLERELGPALFKQAFEELMPRVKKVEDYVALDGEARRRYTEYYDVFQGFISDDEKKAHEVLCHGCSGFSTEDVEIKDIVTRYARQRVFYTDKFYRDQCAGYEDAGNVVIKARSPEEAVLFKGLGFQELPRKISETRMEVSVHRFVESNNGTKDDPHRENLHFLEPETEYVMVTPMSRLAVTDVLEIGAQSTNAMRVFKANKTQMEEVMERIAQGDYARKPSDDGKPVVRSLEEYIEDSLEEAVYTSRGLSKIRALLQREGVVVYNMEGGEPEFFRERMARLWNESKRRGVLVPAIADEFFKVALALRCCGKKHEITLGITDQERDFRDSDYDCDEEARRQRKKTDARAYSRATLSAASNKVLRHIKSLDELAASIRRLEAMDPVYAMRIHSESREELDALWSKPLPGLEAMETSDLLGLLHRVKPQKYKNNIADILLRDAQGLSRDALEAIRTHATGEALEAAEAELSLRELRCDGDGA